MFQCGPLRAGIDRINAFSFPRLCDGDHTFGEGEATYRQPIVNA